MEPGKLMRTLLIGSSTLLAIVAVFWMQTKFDGADRRAALGVVHHYRSKTGWSIPELLDRKHPGQLASWSVETQSSCLQHERVHAEVGATKYVFMVDINGPSIHPGNKDSEAVVAELDTPKPPGAGDAGAPSPTGATAPRGSAAPAVTGSAAP